MRTLLLIALIVGATHIAAADQPQDEILVSWQKPFEAISPSQSPNHLVLLLITNEDPFVAEAAAKEEAERNAARKAKLQVNPPAWCAGVLVEAYRRVIDRRPDLKSRLSLQSISAGLPLEVTGGVARNHPARAVLACCDANYRLLGLVVGVPDVNDLLTLIEDAEGVASIRQLHADRPQQIVNLIAQRSSERLNRAWRGALEEIVMLMQGNVGDEADETTDESAFQVRVRLLGATLEPTYLADVRLRFGLTEASDRTRLVILEQHIETRRPWCEAMMPFVAGADFLAHWRELVGPLWDHQPITADADATEFVEWFDSQIDTDSLVLSVLPPLHQRHLPWPPIVDKSLRRGIGWQDVHARVLEHPFRQVDAQQLALLIRSRDLKPIDIRHPSTARYLFIEPNKKLPMVIRETDPPGRFAGLLKRSKSSLVSE